MRAFSRGEADTAAAQSREPEARTMAANGRIATRASAKAGATEARSRAVVSEAILPGAIGPEDRRSTAGPGPPSGVHESIPIRFALGLGCATPAGCHPLPMPG